VGAFDALINTLLPGARVIDAVNTWIGKRVAWLILVAVIISAVNATVRKVFSMSSNSWLELQWVLFSAVFLLCSPWTLLANEHIRIDIVNNLMPQRARNIIDVVGHAFFVLPLCVIMIVTGYPFALSSLPTFSDVIGVIRHFPDVFYTAPTYWLANLADWFGSLLGLGEQSSNSGGLPQWPAKSLIMIAFSLLFLQALSELVKRIAVMRGLIPDPHASQKSSLESEAEELIGAIEKP
jgi:TRAP-type mannitol/chloroaromatic compound transport system permease small subunit